MTAPLRTVSLAARRRFNVLGPALVLVLMLPVAVGVGSTLNAEGFERYRSTWLDASGWSVFGRSLGFGATAACWALAFAWPVAAWSSRLGAGARYTVLALAALPIVLPGSLLAVGWVMALGRDGVVANGLGIDKPWLTIYDKPVAAAAIGLRYFGLAALPMAIELRRLRLRSGFDHAYGLPGWSRWWWLTARPVLPAAVAGFVLVLVFAINDHIMASMFLVQTYGTQVLVALNAMLDARLAMVRCMPMVLGGLVVSYAVARRLRGASVGETHVVIDGESRGGFASAWGALSVMTLALGAPLVALAVRAGSARAVLAAFGEVSDEFQTTAVTLAIAVPITLAAGLALARAWRSDERAGRFALAALLVVNLVLPGSVLALGTLRLFEAGLLATWRDTAVPLAFALVARFTPLAALLLFAVGRRESATRRDAAKAFGLRAWAIARHIDWPAQRFRLAAVALVVVLAGATELEMAVLLTPAGDTTLGVRLYTMIHTAPDALVSAVALAYALALAGVLIAAGAAVTMHRHNGAPRG